MGTFFETQCSCILYGVWLCRDLEELKLEGNQLVAMPTGLLRLHKLRLLKVTNNFMHPVFWKDAVANHPEVSWSLLMSFFPTRGATTEPPYITMYCKLCRPGLHVSTTPTVVQMFTLANREHCQIGAQNEYQRKSPSCTKHIQQVKDFTPQSIIWNGIKGFVCCYAPLYYTVR